MGQRSWSLLPPWLFVAVPAELVGFAHPHSPPVEVNEAQEYLDIVNTLRLGPLGHRFHPFGIRACALPVRG